VTAGSSGTSDSRVSRVTHTHTLVQKTGVSPVRRHWRAQQRVVSIPEGGRGDTGRGLRDGSLDAPSNLPKGFQRFGLEQFFRAGFFFSDFGEGVVLLMVKSSPGVNPKPRVVPVLDSTECTDLYPEKSMCWPLQEIRLFIRGLCPGQYYSWHATPPLLHPPPLYCLIHIEETIVPPPLFCHSIYNIDNGNIV